MDLRRLYFLVCLTVWLAGLPETARTINRNTGAVSQSRLSAGAENGTVRAKAYFNSLHVNRKEKNAPELYSGEGLLLIKEKR